MVEGTVARNASTFPIFVGLMSMAMTLPLSSSADEEPPASSSMVCEWNGCKSQREFQSTICCGKHANPETYSHDDDMTTHKKKNRVSFFFSFFQQNKQNVTAADVTVGLVSSPTAVVRTCLILLGMTAALSACRRCSGCVCCPRRQVRVTINVEQSRLPCHNSMSNKDSAQ